MMDRKTMLVKILLLPVDALTVLPFVVGATLGLGAWAVDARSGLWYFSSVTLMMLSALVYVQRTALGWTGNVAKVLATWRRDQERLRGQQLDDLGERLKGDNDSRTDELLDDLRLLTRDLAREVGQSAGWVRSMTAETMAVVDQLFGGCVQYLEKTLELYRIAQSIKDRAIRQETLNEREVLIEEVQKSLCQLGEILVNVRAINLKYATNTPAGLISCDGLAQLRGELALKLQAAKEIERAVSTSEPFPNVNMKKYIEKAKESKVKEGGT